MKLKLFGKKQQENAIINIKKYTNKKPVGSFQYSYSIIPTNFVNISEESQAQKLGQFNDILRVIEDRIKITMSRRLVPITVEGQITEMPVMQVHLESHQPLGDILDQIKLEYISGDRPPKNKIVKENLSSMEIQDNNNTIFAMFHSTWFTCQLALRMDYQHLSTMFPNSNSDKSCPKR